MTTTMSRRVPPQRLINLINPLVRTVLRSPAHGLVDGALLLLHVVGRRTGRRYDIPVGYTRVDNDLLVITQHSWRVNCRDRSTVDVTYRGRRRPMQVNLVETASEVAAILIRLRQHSGPKALQRATGLTSQAGTPPTAADLEDGVRRFRLACVILTPPDQD